MYSKSKLLGFGLALAMTAVFGCAKRGAPATEPIQIQLKGSSDCISNIGGEVTNFVNGVSGPAEINAFWGCMSQSIQEFKNVTSGDVAGGDQYSPQALRQFITHYFYKNNARPINDTVLAGVMQVKRVLLGGTETAVTKGELDQLTQLFSELNAVTLIIQPSVRVLFRKEKNATDAEIRTAGANLQIALSRLGGWLNRKNQSYNFQAITQTVNALAQWSQENGKDSSTMHQLRQAALVLPEAKSILVGGSQQAILGQEWLSLFNAASRGLYVYLAAANGFDDNLDAALNRTILPESAQLAVSVFGQSAQQHANGMITLQEFNNLFSKMAMTDWLPTSVNAKGLTAAWSWLLERMLGDGVTTPQGLGLVQVGVLQQQLTNWLNLLNLPAQDPTPIVRDLNKILAASAPISWDSLGRMIYPEQLPTAWSADARRHMTWPYVILRWVKEAYVGAATATLGPDQITTAATEVLPLLQNFGWLKSTTTKIGVRILREADLFTLASNGDGQLDLNEAVRYLAFVVSSYRSAQVWMDTAKTACGGAQVDCVRGLALQPSSGVLGSMPRLQRVISTWAPGQFQHYMEHAEQTVLGANETGSFTTGDLLQTWQLMGYIEVFIELYDTSPRDENINLVEANAAYNIYGPTLARLLGTPQSEVLAFFTFMMKYGDTPATMFGGLIAYDYWKWNPTTWEFAAGRDTLMSILSNLATYSK